MIALHPEEIEEIDIDICGHYAENMNLQMLELVGVHFCLGIICFYREIYDGKSTNLGISMSILEIFGVMYNFKVMIVLADFGLNHHNMF